MESNHLAPYSALTEAIKRVDLTGKSLLLTGGGYGIGVSIAKSFIASKISEIILVGRTESKLKATRDELATTKTNVKYVVADIAKDAEVHALFATLPKSPDFLINNAAYLPEPGSFVDSDLSEWWRGFEVNVRGTVLMTQTFIRHRRNTKGNKKLPPAVILTINTIGAYSIQVPNLSAYGSSKAALARWNELAAADVPETEARFISVHPGTVLTAMAHKSGLNGTFPYTEAKLTGDFAVWLVSDEAAFLGGRFTWVNWDIEELREKKDTILSNNLLVSSLSE